MSLKSALSTAKRKILAALAAIATALGIYTATSQTSPVQDVLSWTMPTQYSDNTNIPAGTLTGTRVAWGATAGGPYPNTQDVALPATTVTLTRAETFGRRCYRVAALIGTANGEWSAEVCKNVQAPAKAPTNLTVQ